MRITAFILLVFTSFRPVYAQNSMIAPMPPIDGGMSQLFGQNHWYSVVFRGNGEAVVSTRIVFSNITTSPLRLLEYRVPRVKPEDMIAFQVIREPQCIQYAYPDRPIDLNSETKIQQRCVQYQEPDAYNWYGPSKYQRADVRYSGDTISVTLPQQIQTEKSGSLLLSWRAFGYAKKDLAGAYHFTFETLQASDPVQQLQVGISTDSDLVLRGTKSQVNYRFEDAKSTMMGTADSAAPMANSRLDNYYQQIGYGQIVKNASNLQALESYTVRGSYADNTFRLYTKEIAIGLGVLALLVGISIWIIRRMMRGNRTQSSDKTTPIIMMFGMSFASSILIIAYTVLLVFLSRNLSSLMSYDVQLPVTILILVVSLGVFGLLLFAPCVLLWMRFGVGFGLGTLGLSFLWLIFGLVLYVFIGASGRSYGSPMPLMRTLDQSVSYPTMERNTMESTPVDSISEPVIP